MQDLYFSLAVHVSIVAIILVVLRLNKKIELNVKWLVVLIVLFFGYYLSLFSGHWLTPTLPNFELTWNWGGKISTILLWATALLLTCKFRENFKASDAGFTFYQVEGSIAPAIVMLVIFILLQLLSNLFVGASESYDIEAIIYQATMPGFDEEPMFRGILLYFASLAVISKKYELFGAGVNWGGLLLVLLFSMAHGLMFIEGKWQFSALNLLQSGIAGFIQLWLRERTGSLVFPILAHNCVNLTWLMADL